MSAAAAGAMLGAARFLPLPRLPEPVTEPDEATSAWTVTPDEVRKEDDHNAWIADMRDSDPAPGL